MKRVLCLALGEIDAVSVLRKALSFDHTMDWEPVSSAPHNSF